MTADLSTSSDLHARGAGSVTRPTAKLRRCPRRPGSCRTEHVGAWHGACATMQKPGRGRDGCGVNAAAARAEATKRVQPTMRCKHVTCSLSASATYQCRRAPTSPCRASETEGTWRIMFIGTQFARRVPEGFPSVSRSPVRAAIENPVSVAGPLLATSCLVAEEPKADAGGADAAARMGGMCFATAPVPPVRVPPVATGSAVDSTLPQPTAPSATRVRRPRTVLRVRMFGAAWHDFMLRTGHFGCDVGNSTIYSAATASAQQRMPICGVSSVRVKKPCWSQPFGFWLTMLLPDKTQSCVSQTFCHSATLPCMSRMEE